MSQPQTKDDPMAKIAQLFNPMLVAQTKELKDYFSVSIQELMLIVLRLEGRIDTLERLTSEKKKPAARNTTTKTDSSTVSTTAVGETPVDGVDTSKKFPNNMLLYFREQYKNSGEFRDRYATPKLRDEMAGDSTISQKTVLAQRLTAESTFVWNSIKNDDDKSVYNEFAKEFTAAKEAHQMAVKPAQQTVENGSPK